MMVDGARVKLLVRAFAYNNVAVGVAFNLNGIQIVDATLPKLAIAGVDAVKAFASVAAPEGGQPGVAPPVTPPPVTPHTDFVAGPGTAVTPPPTAAPPVPALRQGAQGYVMADKALAPYAAYQAGGWTDAQLIAEGLMEPADIPF